MGAGILIRGLTTLSGGGVGWISYANLCRSCLNRGTYLWNVRASLRFYVTCISVIACTRVRDTDRQMTRSCSDIPPCPPPLDLKHPRGRSPRYHRCSRSRETKRRDREEPRTGGGPGRTGGGPGEDRGGPCRWRTVQLGSAPFSQRSLTSNEKPPARKIQPLQLQLCSFST